MWCSQRDVATVAELAINAPPELRFDIFYALSNNRYGGWTPTTRATCWLRAGRPRRGRPGTLGRVRGSLLVPPAGEE